MNFWYDDFYQTEIKPMRLNPSAGDYVVTLYNEADLPPYMAGKVGDNATHPSSLRTTERALLPFGR